MFDDTNILSGVSFTLLRFLGRHYRDSYYVRELARLLGIGVGSASVSLARLADAGLVHREERGRLVIYQAAMESPLLREVKVCATLIELNPLILRLRGDGVMRVILFGSAATGDDTHESDIDLLIETDDARAVAASIASAQAGLDREISPLILTPQEFRSLKTADPALYERICAGNVLIEEEEPSRNMVS